jgi:hypothetical protein
MNVEIPTALLNALVQDNVVIFAGSGLSKRFKLPDWHGLVVDVVKELNNSKYELFLPLLDASLLQPIEVLDKMKSEHTAIRRYIRNKYNITSGDYRFHKKIVQVSDKIVTTNYDNAFERAFDDLVVPAVYTSDFNISEINKSNEPYILKLHGTFQEPDNCLIFKSDYINLYEKEKSAVQKLKSIFTDKTILFLGFGFNDPEISYLFKSLDESFSNHNKHFIVATNPADFKEFDFLEIIEIPQHDFLESILDQCIMIREKNVTNLVGRPDLLIESNKYTKTPKIAFLYPSPIDMEMKDPYLKILDCFKFLKAKIFYGILNFRTLSFIDDYDLLIITTQSFKYNVYIEDDSLRNLLVSPQDICDAIPNESIPIVFITNEEIKPIKGYNIINIASFRSQLVSRFIFKTLRNSDFNYIDEEVHIFLDKFFNLRIEKGTAQFSSIYNSNRDLDIGKKSLKNVVGRVEEQSSIAQKILSIRTSNKFLNVKASGGTGKTTLIRKVAYELYIRGYFIEGVTFKSCESVRTFSDFEDLLTSAFNLDYIIDFVDYLIDNHSDTKKDILIILDNFETITNTVPDLDLEKIIDLLKFTTDFGNIVITSRESIGRADDFEDLYSLTPLSTDDALALFVREYGPIEHTEIKILRSDILEDMLNNNPLAIKLVTKSRTRFGHISELKSLLTEHFFESINEDFSKVFRNDADLNIERTRSLFQSINYSYTTLSSPEKLAFELLNYFPDGITIQNLKNCFLSRKSAIKVSDNDFRRLKDKSLVEDYNGILQLQPIIRRFAEYQFVKRTKDVKQRFSQDAYSFNCFVLDTIEKIEVNRTTSVALTIFNRYKNNLLKVFSYMAEIPIGTNSQVKEKAYLLNYIHDASRLILTEKQISEYQDRLDEVSDLFSDVEGADIAIKVMKLRKVYYHSEFDITYRQLSNILSVADMEERVFKSETLIESRYKQQIANIHSMEGYTLRYVKSHLHNNANEVYLNNHFFYLGIIEMVPEKDPDFYHFERLMCLGNFNVQDIEKYIESLHADESLEILQSTYTLSKIKSVDKTTIQRLVVTNPYTRGLKCLMLAFETTSTYEKELLFKEALLCLVHIKYYYLEALYYYCRFLKDNNAGEFQKLSMLGVARSKEYSYQYLLFLFSNLVENTEGAYAFSYSFYNVEKLEHYVEKHINYWRKSISVRY